MSSYYDKYKDMTLEEILNTIEGINEEQIGITNNNILNKILYDKNGIDYKKLIRTIPFLDEDDISKLLQYDKDYKISFLLMISEFADSEDMTHQAIFLMKRHGLDYIKPLLPYCDCDEIREEYSKIDKRYM